MQLFQAAAKSNYSFYLEYVHYGRYKHGRHTELIADHLDRMEKGEIKRLIISLPPRHGKSMTTTESFPSYFIGRNPSRRVITTAYGENLARRFGRFNKQKIDEFGADVFGIRTSRDADSVTAWDVEDVETGQKHRGGMISTGIGGAVTGQGADLLIIDDPVKNRKEAESITYRNMVWDEWKDTLSTRLTPNGAVIVIMTRWHEDDLVGRLLSHEFEGDPDEWTVVSIPAVCEDEATDPLGRKEGETIWPEYGFDEDWAARRKKTAGTRGWASLYQQKPTVAEGQIVKRGWWKYYKVLPGKFDEILQSWDMTFKDNDGNDYVVGQTWGRSGADKYLIDQVRARMDFPATKAAVKSFAAKHPKARRKLVEDKANGPAVIADLKREIPGLIPVNPDGGKVVRATAASADIEAGNVYLPDPSIAPWVHDFVEEWSAFPQGKNDDQVDSSSQAINYMNQNGKRVVGGKVVVT